MGLVRTDDSHHYDAAENTPGRGGDAVYFESASMDRRTATSSSTGERWVTQCAQPLFTEFHYKFPALKGCGCGRSAKTAQGKRRFVVEENAQIAHAVGASNRQTLDAHAKASAGISPGVDARQRQTSGSTSPQPSTSTVSLLLPVLIHVRADYPTSAVRSVNGGKNEGLEAHFQAARKNSRRTARGCLQISKAHALIRSTALSTWWNIGSECSLIRVRSDTPRRTDDGSARVLFPWCAL